MYEKGYFGDICVPDKDRNTSGWLCAFRKTSIALRNEGWINLPFLADYFEKFDLSKLQTILTFSLSFPQCVVFSLCRYLCFCLFKPLQPSLSLLSLPLPFLLFVFVSPAVFVLIVPAVIVLIVTCQHLEKQGHIVRTNSCLTFLSLSEKFVSVCLECFFQTFIFLFFFFFLGGGGSAAQTEIQIKRGEGDYGNFMQLPWRKDSCDRVALLILITSRQDLSHRLWLSSQHALVSHTTLSIAKFARQFRIISFR